MSDLVLFGADEARVLTDEVKADAAALWTKLLRLYEHGAHTALGYSSWGAYYAAEFGGSGSRGEQLLRAARVMEALGDASDNCPPTPRSEAVARELVPVMRNEPERVQEVWAEVVEEHGPEPTAKQTHDVVARILAPAPVAAPTDHHAERMREIRGEVADVTGIPFTQALSAAISKLAAFSRSDAPEKIDRYLASMPLDRRDSLLNVLDQADEASRLVRLAASKRHMEVAR